MSKRPANAARRFADTYLASLTGCVSPPNEETFCPPWDVPSVACTAGTFLRSYACVQGTPQAVNHDRVTGSQISAPAIRYGGEAVVW